jgi:hypothetical protein
MLELKFKILPTARNDTSTKKLKNIDWRLQKIKIDKILSIYNSTQLTIFKLDDKGLKFDLPNQKSVIDVQQHDNIVVFSGLFYSALLYDIEEKQVIEIPEIYVENQTKVKSIQEDNLYIKGHAKSLISFHKKFQKFEFKKIDEKLKIINFICTI